MWLWLERLRQFCEDMDPERDPRDGHYAGQLLWATGFATGQRTLTRHPEADDTQRWQGTIQNEGYKGRVWRGPDPETVHDQMEDSLGPIDAPGQPTKYVITE